MLKKIFIIQIMSIFILLLLLSVGCDLDMAKRSRSDECIECGEGSEVLSQAKALQVYYSPKGTCLKTEAGPVNCHAFAWQINCGIPTKLPNYYLATPSPFWNDGSFILIAEGSANAPLPVNVQVGDKVVYGYDDHSAVVYSIDRNNPLFISYVIGQPNFKVHSPNDSYIRGFSTALSFYRISDSKYCTSQTPPSSNPPPKMRTLRDRLLIVEVADDPKSQIGWQYYARMLNSNDQWRYIWCLSFDMGNGWWERREIAKQSSQNAGIIFALNFPKATKMEVYLYVTDIYGRSFYMVHETRYKTEMQK